MKIAKNLLPFIILTTFALVFSIAHAGSLLPTVLPVAQSYTFSDILNRLTNNVSATAGNHSLNATTSPSATFPTLAQIYSAIPTIYPSDLLASSTYLGVTGSVAVKSGDASAAQSATTTNKLLLTPVAGYYNGTTATVSTTSTAFIAANIRSGTYLFGIVGTLASLLYGDNNANQVLSTASSPGSIAVIAGNTVAASSSIQGTYFVLTVPQGYYSGSDSVTVSTSSINMFLNQKRQTIDDWVNSGGTTGEYIGEESTWISVSGSPFNAGFSTSSSPLSYQPYSPTDNTNMYLMSGVVRQDLRTGLWWSDIAVTVPVATAVATSTTNNFTLTGVAAVGDGTRPTGGNAIGFCSALNNINFGGYNDWYLPTQKQLMQAYIDGAANNLPNPANYFWSSTEYDTTTANAWNVTLNLGYTVSLTKVSSYSVRCVRP